MKADSDLYEGILPVYIEVIKRESPEAAAAIQEILTTVGSQAALHASLIFTMFKIEVKQYHWVPDMRSYAYLIDDYPEAVPLLERALTCCLGVWGIHTLEPVHLKNNSPTFAAKARSNGVSF